MRGFGARVYAVHPIQLCSALQSLAISVNGPWPRLINNYYQRPCLDSCTQSSQRQLWRLGCKDMSHGPWRLLRKRVLDFKMRRSLWKQSKFAYMPLNITLFLYPSILQDHFPSWKASITTLKLHQNKKKKPANITEGSVKEKNDFPGTEHVLFDVWLLY